jgi:predicted MFS family arabinose efflux permease
MPPDPRRWKALALLCGAFFMVILDISIAALAGVPEHQAGLASGLSNTTFQIGAALGVAVVSTVAISRTTEVLAAGGATLGNPRSVPSVDALEPVPQPARD